MTEAATASQVLLQRLIDYAGMYPPESLSLEDAVGSYRRHRRSPHEWMLGPFLCPSSGLCDLEWLLDGEPVPVGVVFDQPAADAIASRRRTSAFNKSKPPIWRWDASSTSLIPRSRSGSSPSPVRC